MKKMYTLEEMIARETLESQQKIKEMSDELILETGLAMIRENLALSQKEMAQAVGVSQSAIAQIEQRGNDVKLATLRKWAVNSALPSKCQQVTARFSQFNLKCRAEWKNPTARHCYVAKSSAYV